MTKEDSTATGFKTAFGGVLGIAFACVFIIGSCTAVSCGSCAYLHAKGTELQEEKQRQQYQQQVWESEWEVRKEELQEKADERTRERDRKDWEANWKTKSPTVEQLPTVEEL